MSLEEAADELANAIIGLERAKPDERDVFGERETLTKKRDKIKRALIIFGQVCCLGRSVRE